MYCYFLKHNFVVYRFPFLTLQVPGYPDWYNLTYDTELTVVYTFKLLQDWKAGDLKLAI